MKFKGLVAAACVYLAAIGCGGSSGTSATINIRTVMLVRGSTSVTVGGSQNGNIAATIPFPSITPFGQYSTTSQTLTATDVGVSPNVTLATYSEPAVISNDFYTLYVTGVEGSSSAPPKMALVLETPPAQNNTATQVRFCNFSSLINAPVDVYVTLSTNTTPLSSLTPTFAGVAFGGVSSYATLPGGTYTVQATAAGNPSNVLFTSSVTTFNNGLIYSNYMVDNTSTTNTMYTGQDIF